MPPKLSYDDVMKMQKERVDQGLPPLGPKKAVTDLSTISPPEKELQIDPNSHIQEESKVGKVERLSSSPVSDYYAMFLDDGEVAYFYAGIEGEEFSVLDAVHIYNTADLVEPEKKHLFEIVWSLDGLKAGLLIDHQFHAVFDFEENRGYCRSCFPPPDPATLFGEFPREWTDECLAFFRK
ncbi:MAG: DUF2251 domain-containing protein [Verrucomicrobia bacterium]|nr:DUF2251 domain-containing protein [Verrucomicrobiota bacterium]